MRSRRISPHHMDWELKIRNWVDFERMVENLAIIRPDIHDGEINFFTFLKFIYPHQLTSQLVQIVRAFEMCGKNQVIRVPWNPMKHPDAPHDKPLLVCPVPVEWGVEDGVNYFHGTNAYNLIDMRNRRIVPSANMAGMKAYKRFPVICACKWRKTPFEIYAKDATFFF